MKRFDLQDALLICGVSSIVGGVAAYSRAAAAIVFGLLCLFFVRAIGRSRPPNKPEGKI
jgi:uncharacterized membrane-anchored protein